jgi:predicted RNase H-like HicB family nuclease
MSFTARVWKGEDGFFVAQCEELPGCITQGKTLEEVKRNFAEALELYLEDALPKGKTAPPEEMRQGDRIRFALAPA